MAKDSNQIRDVVNSQDRIAQSMYTSSYATRRGKYRREDPACWMEAVAVTVAASQTRFGALPYPGNNVSPSRCLNSLLSTILCLGMKLQKI